MNDPHINEAMNEWDRRAEAGEAQAEEVQARVEAIWNDNDATAYRVEEIADIIESFIEGEITRKWNYVEGLEFDIQSIIEEFPEIIAGIIRHYPEIKEALDNSIVNAVENDLNI